MIYSIVKDRLVKLVGKLVHQVFPTFNQDQCVKYFHTSGDDSFIGYSDGLSNGKVFAKYYWVKKELQLNHELFDVLESHFGMDRMPVIIDWFNEEFDQDAEYVSF